MLRKSLVTLACSVALLAPTLASAEVRAGDFTLTPFFGGYTFAGEQHLDTAPVVGLRAGHNITENWGIEGIFDYAMTEERNGTKKHADAYRYGVDGLYHFMPANKLVPYLSAGLGIATVNYEGSRDTDDSTLFNWGGGVKYFLKENVALRGDVRHIWLLEGNEDANFEYTLGMLFSFGKPKPAPVVAPPPPAPKAEPVDSDGDGVYDDKDKCPGTPKGVKVDAVGCPLDTDGDGVYDYLDKCPDTPKGVKVDAVGCPLDTDGDGVYDYLDKCPDTPKGVKVDAVGCPLDTDGDGVYDYLDKCPGTPKGVKVDEVGCPIKKCVEMKLGINFDSDKADVKAVYHDEIAKVAGLLKDLEGSTAVIEGHTDSTASAAYNQKLSQRRADSVKSYLVQKFGIDASRISAEGYGEDIPIADNKTAAGKAENRRVMVIFTCN
jgi:OOP family OmpA-OmpF porin